MLACGTAAAMHAAWAAFVLGDVKLTAVFLVAGVFLLEARWRMSPVRPPEPVEARWRSFRWTVNFISLLIFLFAGYSVGPRGAGMPWFFGRGESEASSGVSPHRDGHRAARETYTGVILHIGKLVDLAFVPPRPVVPDAHGSLAPVEVNRLRIPFSGVYWFYRPPDDMPPANSVHMTGSPDLRRYISLGGWPIRMEARQNLGRTIALGCCSRIAVTLSNGDAYRSTVSVELLLVDAGTSGRALSLGPLPVESDRGPRLRAGPPLEQTLTFILPPARNLDGFDEFRVVFHLARLREDRSPKIAVKDFILIPVGI